MEISAQEDRERGVQRRGLPECKPLLDAAHKELFRRNSFRITGLHVDATTREVIKHGEKLRIMQELGQAEAAQGGAFPLNSPPSPDEVRDAVQKLKDPEKRLVDEFFWFWPEEFGCSSTDHALQALMTGNGSAALQIWNSKEMDPAVGVVAMHNAALYWHLTALEGEALAATGDLDKDVLVRIEGYWREAFKRWELLLTDEALWQKVAARGKQIDDVRLTLGFVQRMRATLPDALDKINAELALSYAEAGKLDQARMHIQFMRETNKGLDNVERTAELVLTPARIRLNEQIRRAKERASTDPRVASLAVSELLVQAMQTLALFDLFFDEQSELRNELSDEVAALCNQLAIIYQNETRDEEVCLDILKTALSLATSIDLRQKIKKNIDTLSGNLAIRESEPIYRLLNAIQECKDPPRLRLEKFRIEFASQLEQAIEGLSIEDKNQLLDSVAIVLRGISLSAWNIDHDLETSIAANELAITYAVSSELRSRLAADRTALIQMRSKSSTGSGSPSEDSESNVSFTQIVIAVIVIMFIVNKCSSIDTHERNSSNTTRSLLEPTDAESKSRNVYRVPRSVSASLGAEWSEIESERSAVESLESQVEQLGGEIKRDRANLDEFSQMEVNQFNKKVERYNELVQEAKTAAEKFNEKVDSYNAKLQRYGR